MCVYSRTRSLFFELCAIYHTHFIMQVDCDGPISTAERDQIRESLLSAPQDTRYAIMHVEYRHATTSDTIIKLTHVESSANPLLRKMSIDEMAYEAVTTYRVARANGVPHCVVSIHQIAHDGSHEQVAVRGRNLGRISNPNDKRFRHIDTCYIAPVDAPKEQRAGASVLINMAAMPTSEPFRTLRIQLDE